MHAHVHHHVQERSNEPMNGSFCLVLANFQSLEYLHILDASECRDTQIQQTNKQTNIHTYIYTYAHIFLCPRTSDLHMAKSRMYFQIF
jgi:hypothetical protein